MSGYNDLAGSSVEHEVAECDSGSSDDSLVNAVDLVAQFSSIDDNEHLRAVIISVNSQSRSDSEAAGLSTSISSLSDQIVIGLRHDHGDRKGLDV